jgi:uncharacterized membrane protein YkoI
MKQTIQLLLAALALAGLAAADGKSLALKDLPAPVQKAVQDNLKGGEIKNISKEVEKGVTEYEVETMVAGKHRDFDVDANGKLVDVEEEIDLATVPAAAKAAIEKKVGAGKLTRVEAVDNGSGAKSYEASFTTKAGKKSEFQVKADGTEIKE